MYPAITSCCIQTLTHTSTEKKTNGHGLQLQLKLELLLKGILNIKNEMNEWSKYS